MFLKMIQSINLIKRIIFNFSEKYSTFYFMKF